MYVGSHFCIPIMAAAGVNALQAIRHRPALFSGREALVIGCCGILPDLVDPHISLVDRLNSWSHTIWFAALFGMAMVLLRRYGIRLRWCMIMGGIAAILMHIACDLMTGGVKPLWPIDWTVGHYVIGSNHWIQLEVITVITTIGAWIAVRYMNRPRDQGYPPQNKSE